MNRTQPEESELETRWGELDLRSLAVFRVALGVFVLLTLASFWGDTAAFFTDSGVLPRSVLVTSGFADRWLCFHLGTGSWHTQVLLNGLLASFAVALIAGWRTPWMVAGCWVLLNSLQVRNPFVCDRGDLQLSLMLFWAFFLPLGARWSLDARAGRRPFGRAQGVAAAALVSQFALIYFFAAYTKNGDAWLCRGDGLEHSLISPLFSTDLSLWVAGWDSGLLFAANYAVIAGEFFVALLLLCPFQVPLVRSLALALLLIFHLGVACLFQLGLFPWLGAFAGVCLLPKEFWASWGHRLEAFLDDLFGADELFEGSVIAWQRARNVFVLCCLGIAFLTSWWSSRPLRDWTLPPGIQEASDALRLSQHWELFSPLPPYYGSFELTVSAPEGTKSLFRGPATREEPTLQPFPSHRWRMLMIASLFSEFALLRPGVAQGLAERIQASLTRDGRLEYAFVVRLIAPDGELQEPERWLLWRQDAAQGPQ